MRKSKDGWRGNEEVMREERMSFADQGVWEEATHARLDGCLGMHACSLT